MSTWIMGYCVRCGKPFVVPGPCEPRYCSETHRVADREDRARARRFGAQREDYARWRIFERDGWCCQLCGEPVPHQANNRDPDCPTVDHIIPLSQGGPDVAYNLQTAHSRCSIERNTEYQRSR